MKERKITARHRVIKRSRIIGAFYLKEEILTTFS